MAGSGALHTVLVVEDDVHVRGLVVTLLDQAGYRPVAIADHELIPGAVERWKPSCVLLDGELDSVGSKRSWADALAIRAKHPTLPVLLFTADETVISEARVGTSERSRAAGFAGVVRKPFVIDEFLATLANVVGTPHPASAREFPAVPLGTQSSATDNDLFGMALHELRSPLTTISGQVQRARRLLRTDPDRATEALDRALAQVGRMNRLMSDVVDHTRLEANALRLTMAPFELGGLVAESIAQYDHAVKSRIAYDPPTAPVHVLGDTDRIEQILGNLLDNALKYSAADAQVEIWLRASGGEAQLRVVDRGVGVPNDECDRLFAPYYRSTRTMGIAGTGLGLHISRRLAERHSGRLWLESTSATGCVFALALPLIATPAA